MDKYDHGTMPKGDGIHCSKLSEDDVRWMRENKGRVPYAEMAQRFGIHYQTAFVVANQKTWRWLG
jgi:hypothetical protein